MTNNTRELKELLLQFIAHGHEPITVTFSGELGDDTKVFQMPFNIMLKVIESWHDTILTQTKQETIQACIDALPEKLPDSRGETPEGTTHHKPDGSWITAEDYGYNKAIDTAHTELNKLKEQE